MRSHKVDLQSLEMAAPAYCCAPVPWNRFPNRVANTCGCIAHWSVEGKAYCKRHAMGVVWNIVCEELGVKKEVGV